MPALVRACRNTLTVSYGRKLLYCRRKQRREVKERTVVPVTEVLLENKAYQRQLRRRVRAPRHRFAAIVQPQLRSLCAEELSGLELADIEITAAGVEFSGKLSDCCLTNLWLRIASRILCRLPAFRAGVSEELFHKVSTYYWELWLSAGIPLRVEAHVEDSRIRHEGKVAETVLTAVQKRFQGAGLKVPPAWPPALQPASRNTAAIPDKQRILVHLHKNRCQISLDTSGVHLHQRGYRLHHTGAPLRETLAAALLLKAGWHGDCPLVDGMSGAGTVPIEAAFIARRLPPGLKRSFLFQSWPAFPEKNWDYLCRTASASALAGSPVPIVGVESDPQAVAVARENADRAGVGNDIRWVARDFFDFRPRQENLSPGLLILDPPYGKRLPSSGAELFERLGVHLQRHFEGWKVVILVPERSLASWLRLGTKRFWQIQHGGLLIWAVLARVESR